MKVNKLILTSIRSQAIKAAKDIHKIEERDINAIIIGVDNLVIEYDSTPGDTQSESSWVEIELDQLEDAQD